MKRLKIQLHLHTKQDPLDNIKYSEKQAIDRAAKLGYEVMAITCHNVVIFNDDLRKYAEEKRILLIPGIEKSIERKHVVILNAEVEAQNIQSFNDLAKYRKDHPDCFVIAAHPYNLKPFSLRETLEERIELFDAIEYTYFHTKRLNKANQKAVKTAEKHNKPVIATADCHFIKYLDHSYSIINTNKDIPSVFKALRTKEIQIISHDLAWWQYFLSIPLRLGIGSLIKYFTLK